MNFLKAEWRKLAIINYDIKYRMGQDTEENGDHNQAA